MDDNSKMVAVMLLLVSLINLGFVFPSINCSTSSGSGSGGGRIRDAGGGQFSDSFHQVLGCTFQQEQHHHDLLAWEMSVSGFHTLTGPTIALTYQDFFGNSTTQALSVCDLISNQRVLVIICTLESSHEASSLIAAMEDFTAKLPTPCGEPVLPKAKLQTASSVMYMLRHTSGRVSCFNALITPFNWQKAFDEQVHFKFHKDDVTLNLTSLAAYSSNKVQKLRGLIEMDEASSFSTTTASSSPHPYYYWSGSEELIGCKGALVGTRGNYRSSRQEQSAGKAVLRVGVPVRSNITDFVSVNNDAGNRKKRITGFSVDVFEAAARRLPYKFTYKLIPFYGSSHELVKKVARESFDVAVGDIVISNAQSSQYQAVEFSVPYLEPAFTMVVRPKNNEPNNFWVFLSPFTPKMWLTLVALSVFTGFVIWLIERDNEDIPRTNFWVFLSLFLLNERPLRRIASRISKVVWLFVVLILTQTYTTKLTSTLTASQSDTSVLDVDSLKRTNAAIGCDGQSQSITYLVKVLGFKRRNIRVIASVDDYGEALSSGNIKAAFLLTPYAKVLLATHCADFTHIDLSYRYNNLGGFGFVFPKGSPLAADISAAIVELEGSGELQLMEEDLWSSFSDCSGKLFEDASMRAIGPSSFGGLFVIAGVTSTITLLITSLPLLYTYWEGRIQRMLMGRELWIWLTHLIQNQRRDNNDNIIIDQ